MSLKINQDMCVGCGACAGACPESFGINAEGKAEVLAESLCADNGLASCPVGAISVE